MFAEETHGHYHDKKKTKLAKDNVDEMIEIEMPNNANNSSSGNGDVAGQQTVMHRIGSSPTFSPVSVPRLNVSYVDQATREWQSDFKQFPLVDTANISKKEVVEFYEKQNEMVDEYSKLFKSKLEHSDETTTEGDLTGRSVANEAAFEQEEHITPAMKRLEYWCIHLSFWTNVCLFVLKCSASILSVSLSVITSTIDSALDLLSGLIIYITSLYRRRKNDIYQYPIGRNRLEPIGFVIFATCMCTASLQIIKEGLSQIVTGLITGDVYINANSSDDSNAEVDWMFGIMIPKYVATIFYWYGIGVLLATILIKLALHLICRRVKHSPSVIAYAFDHRNDVLSNSLLLVSLFLSKYLWWLDSIGAVILSIYIIKSWIDESLEHVTKLVGLTADKEYIQKLTFMALNHSPLITQVDSVMAYYSGANMIVEIDVVLPKETPLLESHDVGETLQKKIESLPDVERCYVHLDYEFSHTKDYEHVVKD
ncbi:predicted protein [Naegleria gruberi]|uniref:Predicted protein n=1 Tax=Naegleria gruberi TaxID=5762 RepID=D2VYT6_NAEGR|nr:uncharacterized protein NAEGRDRAFT_56361 [Naegleria gruberi]EFC37966.1 predicted protein [Naegleria gruberi]|eukprot:XP_002670710.1 predicted protein [Naegleria gruberi strain NEG-M]